MMKLIVAALAAGALALPLAAHAASPFEGSWKGASGPTITYKMSGRTLTRSDSDGMTLVLRVGGSFNAIPNETQTVGGMDAISVRMTGARRMVQVSRRNGRILGTLTSTVNRDGKSMTLVYYDNATHRTTTYRAKKV
jgi:hypothetical protein